MWGRNNSNYNKLKKYRDTSKIKKKVEKEIKQSKDKIKKKKIFHKKITKEIKQLKNKI